MRSTLPPVEAQPDVPAPTAVPVADLVKVMFMSFDAEAPAESVCVLKYTPAARVSAPPTGTGALQGWIKRPGDALDAPLEHILVHAIRPDGVEFSFSDEGREHELLAPGEYDLRGVLVLMGLYVLILLHAIVLLVGGHYTYAEVPLFDWLAEVFNWSRNNYDKLGHFAQGFVPAIVAREILLRNEVVVGRYWLWFIVISICLAISAFYELVEWWVALLTGTAADAFLSLQGYVWDTQSDMMWALCGAVLALLALSGLHDRQLLKLAENG